jgi:phage recombination protein Bet
MSDVPALLDKPRSLVARVAERYGVEPAKMLDTLKATAFKSDKPISNEQMMALLIVSEQYHLNPFTKEIFAFPDKGGIVPVLSVDGWSRIINEHPMMDGCEFHTTDDGSAVTCMLYRKDRTHAISITEYLNECKRNTAPWQSHPRRMLRHKALIQCARLAFGFAGIYDEDEAHRIVHGGQVERVEPPSAGAARVRAVLGGPIAEGDGSQSAVTDTKPPVPPISDDDAPLDFVKTYALYMHDVLNAGNAEDAGQVLDEARSVLTQSQHMELVAAYRGKWQSKE